MKNSESILFKSSQNTIVLIKSIFISKIFIENFQIKENIEYE